MRTAAPVKAVKFRPYSLPAPDSGGYYGKDAATYADTYWSSYNTPWFESYSDDCTNFVSQALYKGGMPFVNYPNYDSADNGTHAWWFQYYQYWQNGALMYGHPNSWTVAEDLRKYLHWDVPGGTYEGTYSGSQLTNAYTPNSVVTGDVLFYRWNGGTTENHASIQVGIGKDPSYGWYGNLIDQHTSNRYHEFWSLYPTNSQYATTDVDFYHIWNTN